MRAITYKKTQRFEMVVYSQLKRLGNLKKKIRIIFYQIPKTIPTYFSNIMD